MRQKKIKYCLFYYYEMLVTYIHKQIVILTMFALFRNSDYHLQVAIKIQLTEQAHFNYFFLSYDSEDNICRQIFPYIVGKILDVFTSKYGCKHIQTRVVMLVSNMANIHIWIDSKQRTLNSFIKNVRTLT